MLIYAIENTISGKKYVGQTITSLNHRFRRGHLSKARTGRRHSEETKNKLSEMRKGEGNPNFGKHASVKTKQKMSIALSGKNNTFYGKRHSEETKRKMRESRLRRHATSMA